MRRGLFDSLRERIEEVLLNESGKASLTVVYQGCARIAMEAIENTKMYIQNEGFADREEEIWFYKEEAPNIWGQFLYYKKLVDFEGWRKSRSREKFREMLKDGLREAEQFPESHAICEYYHQGRTEYDELYFTRKTAVVWSDEDIDMFLDPALPPKAYWLSWMRAYEQLREWLRDTIEEVDYQLSGHEVREKLECKASATEVIELFKGLHMANFFGDKPFAYVMYWVKEMMGVDVANFNNILQNIRARKGDKLYIDKVREGIRKYRDREV